MSYISSIDDHKSQLYSVLDEVKKFQARIDQTARFKKGIVKYGFDHYEDLDARMNFLKLKTKVGKVPSRPATMLLVLILEAVQSGPLCEKDIKAFITDNCHKYGLKSTNRGTIAGSNMEVSAACSILAGLGILESDIDKRKERKQSKVDCNKDPTFNYAEVGPGLILRIIDYLKEMWGSKIELNPVPQESFEQSSKFPEQPVLLISTAVVNSIHASANDNKENGPSDDFLKVVGTHAESEAKLDAHGMSSRLVTEKSTKQELCDENENGSESEDAMDEDGMADEGEERGQKQLQVSAMSSMLNGVDTAGLTNTTANAESLIESSQQDENNKAGLSIDTSELGVEKDENAPKSALSARKSIGTIRGWKLRFRKEMEEKEPFAILNSGEKIKRWNEATYAHASSSELEEKLIRYISGQCFAPLPVDQFQIGTTYLNWEYCDNSINAELEPVGLPTVTQVFSDTVSVEEEPQETTPVIAPHDLNDPAKNITAEYLLQKVAKTKRQRGTATMNVNNNGTPITSISIGIYNGLHVDTLRRLSNNVAGVFWGVPKANSANRKRSISTVENAEHTSIIEYMQSLGFYSPGSIAATTFSSTSLAGEYATVSTSLLRKYVAPAQLLNNDSSMPAVGELAPSGHGLQIPDLSIPTIELPWGSVVNEFQPIQSEEEIMNALQHSNSEAGLQAQHSDQTHQDNSTSYKKAPRSLKSSQKLDVVAAKATAVVHAPQFVELGKPMISVTESNSTGDSDEDISDENMLEKHDEVLRQMREKWALMHKLKVESRKDSGTTTHVSARKFETMRSPSKSFADAICKSNEFVQQQQDEQDKYMSDAGGFYDLNSLKRRGRPPKLQKTSHLSYKNS